MVRLTDHASGWKPVGSIFNTSWLAGRLHKRDPRAEKPFETDGIGLAAEECFEGSSSSSMGRFPMPIGMGQLGFVRDQRAAGIANRHPDTPAALRVPVMERHGVQAQKFSNTRFDSHASNLMHGTSAPMNLRDNKGWIFDPRSAINNNDARPHLKGIQRCRTCVSKSASCFHTEGIQKAAANYQADFMELVGAKT